MNFDDLHDPSPPRPGAAELAAVATRAKTMRRRRVAFTSVGAALAVAVVAVPVGLALREEDSDRLVPATMPTVEPDGSVPAVVTTTTAALPTTTDAVVEGAEPMLTAVTADGVGVIIDEDGSSTVLKGADVADTGLVVRTVLLSPARRSFVGLCCLPVGSPDDQSARWGEFLAGELDRPGEVRSMAPDAAALAVLRERGVVVTDLDGEDVAVGRPAGDSTVVDVAFLPDGRLAVVDLFSDADVGFVGRLHVTDGDLSTLAASAGTILGPVEGNGTWQLAGTDASGNVLVAEGGDGAFNGHPRGFDPDTLVEVAAPPTTGAESVLDVWFSGAVATYVDVDGVLWHDGAAIPGGPFRHARPVETAPATSPDPTTTTSTTAPSVPTSAPGAGSIVGFSTIRADGDAEVVYQGEAPAVVYDGADPSAAPPEGELTTVDSFVQAPGGRMYVSTCCEPVPGTWLEIPVGDAEPDPAAAPRYGHGLAVSPDGQRLAIAGFPEVQVTDLDGGVLTTVPADALDGSLNEPTAVIWLDDVTIAVVVARAGADGGGQEYVLHVGAPDELDLVGGPGVVVGGFPAGGPFVDVDLAGVDRSGNVLVRTTDGIVAHDPVTLAESLGPELPPDALDVWVDRGVITYVDAGGALWHDGERIADGPYTWARPIVAP